VGINRQRSGHPAQQAHSQAFEERVAFKATQNESSCFGQGPAAFLLQRLEISV